MNAPSKIEVPDRRLVYDKIVAVQGALAKHGIGKDRTAKAGNTSYKFRGIDDVYNALAPLLAEHGLMILPRMLSRDVVERKSSSGNALFYVTVEAEFDFVAADDGSSHTVRTFGEAMDSGDKATNKAMSAAYKYAAFMAFAIPTEGDNDSENATHEVAARDAGRNHDDRIDEKQLAMLKQLLDATKTTEGAFLKGMGAPADAKLFQLPQSFYADAVEKLNLKLARMAKAETNARAGDQGDKQWSKPTDASAGEFSDITADDCPF